MIATAGSAMAALVAVHMGQRKNRAGLLRHEMAGAVVRRNGAVSVFADEVIPQSSQKAIELGGIEVKGGYNLDAGPEGVEASVGGEIA